MKPPERKKVNLNEKNASGIVKGRGSVEILRFDGSRGGAMAGAAGKKLMLFGSVCCGIGIAANAMTYSGSASTQELTYVLAWGAIIFGGIQIIRGAVSAGPNNQA